VLPTNVQDVGHRSQELSMGTRIGEHSTSWSVGECHMFLEGAWLPTLRLRSDIDAPTATGVKNEASRVSGQMREAP